MELELKHLTERTTLEQAIIENMVDGMSFGRINDDWLRLLDKRIDGDELWHFEPPGREVI